MMAGKQLRILTCLLLLPFLVFAGNRMNLEEDSIPIYTPNQDLIRPAREPVINGDDKGITEGLDFKEEIQSKPLPSKPLNGRALKKEHWVGQVKVILILLGIAALAAFIFYVLKIGLFRHSAENVLSVEEIDSRFEAILERGESPEELIARQLERAIQAAEYRMAIRLLYLRLLAELHEKRLIAWKKEKTNSDYLREMSSTSYDTRFNYLTRVFESVWYGNHRPGKEEFFAHSEKFGAIKQELNQVSEL